jgi:hypothetical protein
MNQEFVSEDYDTSAVSMDDIRREIEQLTVTKKNPNTSNSKKAGSPGKKNFKLFSFSIKYLSIKMQMKPIGIKH